MKREATFQTIFRHWLKANPLHHPAAFELKQTTKEYLAFDAVEEHQLDFLRASGSNKGMLYKIPDDSRGLKPYDMVYLRNVAGYIVIRFPTLFCLIDVEKFISEKSFAMRKSLTSDRAREIAHIVIEYP